MFSCHFLSLTLCSNFVGKRSEIKCKKEANAPTLVDFIKTLGAFEEYGSDKRQVRIVTDDVFIMNEIELVSHTKFDFMRPEPAPRRIPDKVFYHKNLQCYCTYTLYTGRKRRSLQS